MLDSTVKANEAAGKAQPVERGALVEKARLPKDHMVMAFVPKSRVRPYPCRHAAFQDIYGSLCAIVRNHKLLNKACACNLQIASHETIFACPSELIMLPINTL